MPVMIGTLYDLPWIRPDKNFCTAGFYCLEGLVVTACSHCISTHFPNFVFAMRSYFVIGLQYNFVLPSCKNLVIAER